MIRAYKCFCDVGCDDWSFRIICVVKGGFKFSFLHEKSQSFTRVSIDFLIKIRSEIEVYQLMLTYLFVHHTLYTLLKPTKFPSKRLIWWNNHYENGCLISSFNSLQLIIIWNHFDKHFLDCFLTYISWRYNIHCQAQLKRDKVFTPHIVLTDAVLESRARTEKTCVGQKVRSSCTSHTWVYLPAGWASNKSDAPVVAQIQSSDWVNRKQRIQAAQQVLGH